MENNYQILKNSTSKINTIGQSIWCDNLSKEILDSGELQKLIDAGVSGLTSNPTIFKKAIADSAHYDKDIIPLKSKGMNADDVTEELMIQDVRRAAKMFLPVYQQTAGADGYVSIEVSPTLAHDAQGTFIAGERIWSKLDMPNIMIKVPATAEGLIAVKKLLSAGINVNITLIFSNEVYGSVINAYLEALEERVAAGKDINHIASVASFFVSRVDTAIEKALSRVPDKGNHQLILNEVGVANCHIAYDLFQQKFSENRFKKLQANGARVQRALWASTGTKSPALGDLYYVEALVAANTVNTVPPTVLAALAKGANISEMKVDTGKTKQLLSMLKEEKIDFTEILLTLQDEGVKLFADSYNDLIKSIQKKI